MHMRLVRLVLCLIYGLEFIRTFDFASANTVVRNRFPIHSSISTLQTDGANLNFHPDANSDRHSDSESDPGSKIHSELNLDARLAARLRSAYLPNEMMDRKPKRSEFVDTSLETNLDSEEEEDKNEQVNQTRSTAEELLNQKEIIISQQILLVLCFGFIILIFAISRIIMNLGKSIDNRKYLLMEYQH